MKQINKNKVLVYVISAGCVGLLFGLLSGLVFHYLAGYIVLWTLTGLAFGSCISRVVFHIYYSDSSAEMWQVTIYHFLIGIGLLGVIYSDSWGWADAFIALVAAMTLMAACTRFIRYHGGTLMLYRIDHDMRYYPIDDNPKNDEDTSRPLILYEGTALTLEEAKAKGLTEAVALARADLIRIYGITLKEEKEN